MNPSGESRHPARDITIYVNLEARTVQKEQLSYSDVVNLASGLPTGPNILYSVTYQRGHAEQSQGTLVDGQSVKAKDGMVFSVTPTDRS
jgi:hypothetical protein